MLVVLIVVPATAEFATRFLNWVWEGTQAKSLFMLDWLFKARTDSGDQRWFASGYLTFTHAHNSMANRSSSVTHEWGWMRTQFRVKPIGGKTDSSTYDENG